MSTSYIIVDKKTLFSFK